nr:hypothetical protein [Stackebrandtia endophytica]
MQETLLPGGQPVARESNLVENTPIFGKPGKVPDGGHRIRGGIVLGPLQIVQSGRRGRDRRYASPVFGPALKVLSEVSIRGCGRQYEPPDLFWMGLNEQLGDLTTGRETQQVHLVDTESREQSGGVCDDVFRLIRRDGQITAASATAALVEGDYLTIRR